MPEPPSSTLSLVFIGPIFAFTICNILPAVFHPDYVGLLPARYQSLRKLTSGELVNWSTKTGELKQLFLNICI